MVSPWIFNLYMDGVMRIKGRDGMGGYENSTDWKSVKGKDSAECV